MTKNIIIVDKELERIKYIINNIINSIGENNIKIFVASTIDEVRKICVINNINPAFLSSTRLSCSIIIPSYAIY